MAQINVGAGIGAVNGALWFEFSPAFLDEIMTQLQLKERGKASAGIVVALLIFGVLVVGSIERTLASAFLRRAGKELRRSTWPARFHHRFGRSL